PAELREHVRTHEEVDATVRAALRIAQEPLRDDALAALHRRHGRVRGRERPCDVTVDVDARQPDALREVVEDALLEPPALAREESLEVESLVVRRPLV